jgi:hypothetical protein
MAVANRVSTGWIAAADDNYPSAIGALEEATELEDELLYGEPPEWSVPVQQDLGKVLLEAGRYKDAERSFLADLERFPGNIPSQNGLEKARQIPRSTKPDRQPD